MLGKQAKVLSTSNQNTVVSYLSSTRHSLRNICVFRLSVNAGMRAKEIASVSWDMLLDVDGNISDSIRLTDIASKGKSGRIIPISKKLHAALFAYYVFVKSRKTFKQSDRVILSQKQRQTKPQTIVNMFALWYKTLGFTGASSHSGRRTFITNISRKISTVGGSMRDVQVLAGHSNLQTTQRYIDQNVNSQHKVVALV